MGANIRYLDDQRKLMCVRSGEQMGEAKQAFHEFHQLFEEALQRTQYFKDYGPPSCPEVFGATHRPDLFY